MKVTILVVVSG